MKTIYDIAYKEGFKHGALIVGIIFSILIILIYLIIMTQSDQDPIQAYLDKQQVHQNYLSNSDNEPTDN